MPDQPSPNRPIPLYVVSLGCPKNRVDTEVMLGHLTDGGYELTGDPAEAELILVNTCAFLQQAIEESVNTVLELAQYKEHGACERLLVAGCLVQSHGAELAVELPEVDAFIGLGELQEVLDAARGEGERLLRAGSVRLYDHRAPRRLSLPPGAAYLKVSEGCNRSCSFCRIPAIRGRQQSRSMDSLVTEARRLAGEGVVELNLVAQDLTAYGRDLGPDASLPALLRKLQNVDGLEWIRLLYLYPNGLSDELVELLGGGGKLLPYVDLPLQHVADPILKAMRRGHDRAALEDLMDRLRAGVPGFALRSTFIVGFPGETDADFQALYDFVEQQRPARVAVFRFSPEPETHAAELPDPVPAEVAEARHEALSLLGERLSQEYSEALRGQVMDTLVEGPSEESELLWQGRIAAQGPEDIDGLTYLPAGSAEPGTIVPVRIRETHPHDLVGEPVGLYDDDDE